MCVVALAGQAAVGIWPGLRPVNQGALTADHVLDGVLLLLAALTALGIALLACLAAFRAGVLQLLQQLFEFRHLPLGVVHAAFLGGLLHLLRHAVEFPLVHGGRVGVERDFRAVLLRLLGQRLHVALDGFAQLFDALLKFGLLFRGVGLGLDGIAHGLACLFQRAGRAVRGAILQRQRQLPHAGLGLVHGVLPAPTAQQRGNRTHVERHAGRVVIRLGLFGEDVQQLGCRVAFLRGQAELPPYVQHGAGERVVELAFRQHELRIGAAAGLARRVARHHAALHGQSGPGMGGQVLRRGSGRGLGRAGQRHRNLERGSIRTVPQAQLDADAGHAIIVRRAPRQANLRRAALHHPRRSRWLRERGGRGQVGNSGQRPGLGAALALHRQGAAGAKIPLRLPACGVQGMEGCHVAIEGQRRLAAAAGDVDDEVGTGRDGNGWLLRAQEHGRHAGIGRRSDPGLDDGGRGRRTLRQRRGNAAQQSVACFRPGNHDGCDQRQQQCAAQRPAVACGQAGLRCGDPHLGCLRRHARQVHPPKGGALFRMLRRGVSQDGQRPVAQAGVPLQPAVGEDVGRERNAANGAPN